MENDEEIRRWLDGTRHFCLEKDGKRNIYRNNFLLAVGSLGMERPQIFQNERVEEPLRSLWV